MVDKNVRQNVVTLQITENWNKFITYYVHKNNVYFLFTLFVSALLFYLEFNVD